MAAIVAVFWLEPHNRTTSISRWKVSFPCKKLWPTFCQKRRIPLVKLSKQFGFSCNIQTHQSTESSYVLLSNMPWCKKNESSLGACRSLQLSCGGFCGSSTCERNIWNTWKCIEIWKHNENICYSYAVRMLSVSIRLGGGSQSFVYFLENCIGPCIFCPSLWRSRAIVERCRTNRPIPATENSAVSPETRGIPGFETTDFFHFSLSFKLWNAFHGESATMLERWLMFSSASDRRWTASNMEVTTNPSS